MSTLNPTISCRDSSTVKQLRLGVNIDHLATMREQRKASYPHLEQFVHLAQEAGVDQITLHLREDRRHIQDYDVWALHSIVHEMNLEIAMTEEMLAIACKLRPAWVCFVPERRVELTTEGGLLITDMEEKFYAAIKKLNQEGIQVSLFINAEINQVECAKRIGAQAVEFNTGGYANWWETETKAQGQSPKANDINLQLAPLTNAARRTVELNMFAHAGHGLTLDNVAHIAAIHSIRELNIGHAVVCDALVMGWVNAINAMQKAMIR